MLAGQKFCSACLMSKTTAVDIKTQANSCECQTKLGLYCRRFGKSGTSILDSQCEKASYWNLDIMQIVCLTAMLLQMSAGWLHTSCLCIWRQTRPPMRVFLKRWILLCGFPLIYYVLTGEILCHWDTGRVCTDNSGGGWSQEDCLPVRN